uniref:Uncharacterized protein n=1 Tax=Anguilla anguilla TaxID=7936 RepID=A0A0E9WA80_ANGAN
MSNSHRLFSHFMVPQSDSLNSRQKSHYSYASRLFLSFLL